MNQNQDDRRRYISWIFLPTILAIVIQTAMAIMALEFYVVAGMSTYKDGDYTSFVVKVINNYTNGDGAALSSVAYAIVTTVVAFYIFKKIFREGRISGLANKSQSLPLTVAGVIMFSCGMNYVTLYLLNALASAFPTWLEEYNNLLDAAGVSSTMTIPKTAYAIILGPICEELLFRGITFFAAKKVMPVHFAILVQAIMFGAFHMNKLQGIYAFVLGLGLGYIMHLYDSLFMTILIHIIFNFIGTIGSEYLPNGGDSLISFFLCMLSSLVVTYLSIICLRKGAANLNNDDIFTDI